LDRGATRKGWALAQHLYDERFNAPRAAPVSIDRNFDW
jgi:hypothetical protein